MSASDEEEPVGSAAGPRPKQSFADQLLMATTGRSCVTTRELSRGIEKDPTEAQQ